MSTVPLQDPATTRWRPISEAPQGQTILCRSGANLYFAAKFYDVWRRTDGRAVEPEEFLEASK